ncbi:hypothetical protein [Desulfonatronovibrio magnus]|uniref:hypothetical protein n=1 Tax=Desulfonatronovibrio magnus TaxID=698827 RepID=UPI001E2B8CF6|nr:hypothetical protein [Desulfonatronovibrio magnus]
MPSVISTLSDAAVEFDRLDEVRESAWFRTDRSRVEKRINDHIEKAIGYLENPRLLELRQNYQKLEDAVIADQDRIADLRERRLSAQAGEPSLRRYVPTQTMRQWTAKTRGDYDILIEAYQQYIQEHEMEMDNIKTEMSELLSDMGVELNPEQVEFWLSSVIGDDVLSMSIVFSNIEVVTLQLANLTQESGESLSYARRYYGMLVMLHKLVVQMQNTFIEKVNSEVLPSLKEFSREADKNIKDARQLIRAGGNKAILENNIKANELTKQVVELYHQVVSNHMDQVKVALSVSSQEMQVAVNTYNTVRLSSDVASLIRDGLNTFETLSNLHVPAAETFHNKEIRDEFRRLTERLKHN